METLWLSAVFLKSALFSFKGVNLAVTSDHSDPPTRTSLRRSVRLEEEDQEFFPSGHDRCQDLEWMDFGMKEAVKTIQRPLERTSSGLGSLFMALEAQV